MERSKNGFFESFIDIVSDQPNWSAAELEAAFKELASVKGIKAGEVLLPLRIMLVGGKFGPAVFDIATLIGKEQITSRIRHALQLLQGAA